MRYILILLLLPVSSFAQLNKNFVLKANLQYSRLEYCGSGLFGFEQNGKIGYMDANQKIVIPATLDLKLTSTEKIPSFINNYAVIKLDGKCGMIDKTGKTIIPFEYNSITPYRSQKNIVRISKEVNYKTVYGLLSTQNKIIIPVEYTYLTIDSNLVTVQQNNKFGVKDITGKELLPIEYTSLTTYAKEKVAIAAKGTQYGFIDLKGNWLFEKSASVYTLYNCFDNMIRCKINSKYGYLDMKGNEAIITKYDYADDFFQYGLARVGKSNSGTGYKTLYGYINKKGEEVIPLIYESISLFENGFAYAKDPETNRYGFLDKTGKWAIKPIYISINDGFDDFGGAWVKTTDNMMHYISKTGKDFGTLDSTGSETQSFNEGYAVSANSTYPYALIDQKGNLIKTIEDCDGIYSFVENIAGYKSKKTGHYGFLDINGNKTVEPDYTGFNGFSNGLAKVSKTINGKTKNGYINTKGEIVIPIEYESASSFSDGWALVYKDSTYSFIDKSGVPKNPPRKYDELVGFNSGLALGVIKNPGAPNTYYYINKDLKEAFSITAKSAYSFWEDVAVIIRESTYELINKKGESVKLLEGIDYLKFTKEGKLAVRSENKWGYIDTKGNQVIPIQYDSCDSFKDDYAKVQVDGKWGIIDKTGKTIIKPAYKNIVPGDNGVFIYFDAAWGIIDKNGKVITKDTFLTMTPFVLNKALARFGKSYSILKSPLAK